jgi:6-phosphogluconolactonase (cycloisomerase 2 family)
MVVYVGSYGSGISIFSRTGAHLEFLDHVDAPDPSYLLLDPDGRVLYAVDELTDPAVASFAVSDDGRLRELSRQPTGGGAPCHLLRHPAGYLLAANYESGSVAVHPIRPDGTLGARADLVQHTGSGPAERQQGPHAHEVRLVGDLLVVVDLGLDRLIGYRLDPATGRLSVAVDPFARTHPGAGPRHAVTHPNGRWYVAGELDSTVSVFDPDPSTGVLREVAALPTTAESPSYPSSIVLSADARRLYVANRGPDTITTFDLDGAGDLTLIDEVSTGGSWPRHFAIDDAVLFVANQKSNSVVSFALDPSTGLPRPTGDAVPVGAPTCVLPVPA